MKRRVLAALLCGCMVLSLVGCGGTSSDSEGTESASGTESAATTTSSDVEYTYHSTIAAFNTFSATDWQLSNEWTLIYYTSTPLWDYWYTDENEDNWEIVSMLATDYPTDVTADYAGNETYGVPEDATEGYAYTVTIRDDATWADGTPITTADFEYSLQQYLNPDMKNYRASTWYDSAVIANAKAYYSGGVTAVTDNEELSWDDITLGDEESTLSDGSVLYIAWSVENNAAYTFTDYEDYFDADTYAALDALASECTLGGYIALTQESYDLLFSFTSSDDWGNEDETMFLDYLYYVDAATSATWDQVGFIANDDYTFTIVLTVPLSEFYFIYNFASFILLNEDLYEANKQDTGGLIKSSYGTSVDTYMSYGPYSITTYQEDKQVYLERNENWFGYSDSAYDDCYMTDAIDYQMIDEHTTILSMFLQGNLDDVTLSSDDMEDYGTSDYVYYIPESYTSAFAINTDYDTLKAREEQAGDNVNKTILTYLDFRKAISLSYNREDYVAQCTSGYDATYGLLNDIYVYDPDTMSKYRDTDVANQVLCDVYDVSDVSELTGYNVEEASALLQSAYDAAYEAGDIDDDDIVTIDFAVYGTETIYQRRIDYLQDSLDAAAEGTSLEGRIQINLVEDQNYYVNMQEGNLDLIAEAWGGADMDPYTLIQVYTDPSYVTEYGFDPTTEQCTITVDGEEKTMSFYEWYIELAQGTYATAENETRLQVLAGLEEGILLNYHVIPLAAYTEAYLYSQRIIVPSDEYVNSLVGLGDSLITIKYTMTDAEWEEYCAEQNNQLTY